MTSTPRNVGEFSFDRTFFLNRTALGHRRTVHEFPTKSYKKLIVDDEPDNFDLLFTAPSIESVVSESGPAARL